MATAPSTSEWEALQGAIAGELLRPGSADYELARRPAMRRFWDVRPAAVVRCRTPADVAEALAFARRSGLHATPRSGGHCVAGRSSTTGIVIDVTPMNTVTVADAVATVGAGARLANLYDALDRHGLTIPGGCGPTVGIAGLTLGGGLGILGRVHGLTCDQLVAAQIVLADGRVVECNNDDHPDLFWALRGAGGGQFGVVTSLVFRTVPAPMVTTFQLTWPYADAAALAGAWQDWAPAAQDELMAGLRMAGGRDVGEAPVVSLVGALLGDQAQTIALLAQLVTRSGAEPATASYAELPYRRAKASLAGLEAEDAAQATEPEWWRNRSEFFRRPLPSEGIAALLSTFTAGRRPGQSREVNFTPMGGAYNRVPADATAFVHRQERFLVEHVVAVDARAPEAAIDAAEAWLASSWRCVHPFGSGRVYPNFPDPDLVDWADAYYGANHSRLARVKRRYDPQKVFTFDQFLGPDDQSIDGPTPSPSTTRPRA